MTSIDKISNKQIMLIFIPIVLQQCIMNVLNIIDNFMAGRFGDVFISGITIVNRAFTIPNSMFMGLIAACAVFISQYHGKEDKENIIKVFKISIDVSIIMLLPFIIIGIFFPDFIVSLFTKDLRVIEFGAIYMRLVALSLLPYMLSQCIANSLRSIGQVRTSLIINFVVVFAKISLNYVFLYFPFNLGIVGAGLSLILSRLIELCLYLFLMKSSSSLFAIKPLLKAKYDFQMVKKIMAKMLPLGLNELLYGIILSLLYVQYGSYNSETLAGYSIALTYYELFRVLFGSIGMTMNIFVLPSLGRKEFDNAKLRANKCFRFGIMVSLILAIVMYISSYSITSIYSGTAASLETGTRILRIIALMFPFTTLHSLFYFIFRSGGDNFSILIVDSLFMLCVTVPIQYLCIHVFKMNIYTTLVTVESMYLVKCYIAIIRIKKGVWLKNLTG
ncbi:MATE family efflux transporter [Anaerorhabdus sp.]|uniref:MATE family efflux transporter n=1 Tax=Anaerorhabdus sp. TaxID=1872524 RepID=UPI002FC5BF52